MIYQHVLGLYKRSVFLWYLKSFTPEFSCGNPSTPKVVKANNKLCNAVVILNNTSGPLDDISDNIKDKNAIKNINEHYNECKFVLESSMFNLHKQCKKVKYNDKLKRNSKRIHTARNIQLNKLKVLT